MPTDNIQPPSDTTDRQNRELLEKIFASVEKTRKMFLWTLILTLVTFVLPLIGLAIAIPYFINTYISALGNY